jgi:hypothetical protein
MAMRSLTNLDALLTKPNFSLILFQVTVVILLYSQIFTAPLMADFNHLSEAEAIRELAQHEAVKLKFQNLLFLTISISSQVCLL